MKINDLDTYTHSFTGKEISGTLAIGWLDKSWDSSKQNISLEINSDLIFKLRELLRGNSKFRANIIRGQECCDICSIFYDKSGIKLGWSELWIPFNNKIYISPDLILHYIEEHNYVPPQEYLQAVTEIDLEQPFDAEKYNETLIFE